MKALRGLNTGLAAAALAALAPAAQVLADEEEDLKALTTLQSEVSAGLGYVDRDNRRFGQYSGLNEKGAVLLLDADVVRRNDATGTWLKLNVRNLGLDSRSLRFEHSRQGDWGYYIDASQTPRDEPRVPRTGLQGAGSANQVVVATPAGTGPLLELDTRRDALGLGFDKSLGAGWNVEVRFRNEEKKGSRLYGQGTFGNVRFLTDPIDYTTRQFDAAVNYSGEQLQLAGGYYGTDFENANLALNVTNGVAGLSPAALPPGNQSHQYHVTGGYTFTPTLRGSFKMAVGSIRQRDRFPVAPTTVSRDTLDGRIDTRLFQAGLSARPLARLSILANVRRDERDDRTPIEPYLVTGVGATSTFDGTNEPRSVTTTAGKLEGTYQLPAGLRATLGVDREEKQRNQYRLRSVSSRDETQETTARAELRRAIGETLTGAVSFARSEREGSPFLDNILNNGTAGSNKIAPLHLADRKRYKVGGSLGWAPTDAVDVQFRADRARDDYEQRNFEQLGMREGEATLYSMDANVRLSESWEANGFASKAKNASQNAVCSSPANGAACTGQLWAADLVSRGESIGFGLRGKASPALKLDAELVHSRFGESYGLLPLTGAAIPGLPDVTTRVTTLRLAGDYALHKMASVGVQFVQEQYRTNDWTWANWTYSDGTRVFEDPNQTVNFVGFTYRQRFY